jgi:hypothetical protein
MKRYEVTGIPLSPPFSVLAGRRVGDIFEADVDPDIEQLLIGAGALRPLSRPKPQPRQERVTAPAPEPAREPGPVPEPVRAREPEPVAPPKPAPVAPPKPVPAPPGPVPPTPSAAPPVEKVRATLIERDTEVQPKPPKQPRGLRPPRKP